jgi:7-cyano-7-deazaguanine synthase in queuosine biosynthesis
MSNEHHILCGGLSPGTAAITGDVLNLNLWGGGDDENVQLRIEDLHETLYRDIPQQFFDLVEIAAYVYCADQALRRTAQDTDTFGGEWRRSIHFHVPVRCVDLWNRDEIKGTLVDVLGFLSDDQYTFNFHPAKRAPAFQRYLGFSTESHSGRNFERVVMFSGGLDSLAGAIEETLVNKSRVVLVTHESTSKNARLLREIQALFATKAGALKPLHLRVRANKRKRLGKEYTQRTRSFLFASFGVTVAKMMGLDTLRFYENGVVSLNLPVSAQAIGSRQTRTTHPKTLAGFQNLFSLLGDAPFTVENPYLWATKADVVQKILKASCGDMIRASTSCAHTWERTKTFTHCGRCSQCIDRRLAITAAGADSIDPIGNYRGDIFIDPRPVDDDKMILAAYLDRATSANEVPSVAHFISEFPQVTDAFPFVLGGSTKVAEKCFDLYKRHASEVGNALEKILKRYASYLVDDKAGGGCLLRTLLDTRGASPTTVTPSDDIDENLAEIRNRGADWVVKFKGLDICVKDSVGMRYIAILLQNPRKEFRHSELRLAAFPPEDPSAAESILSTGVARSLPTTDQKTLQAVRTSLEAIKDERKAALESGDKELLEELEEREEKLKKYEKENRNKQGTPRRGKGIHESTRVAVVKGITSVRKQLKKAERNRSFLEEIKCIRAGSPGHLVYFPTEDTQWSVIDCP